MNRRFRFSAPMGLALVGLLPPIAGLIYALAYSLGLAGALSDGFSTGAWEQLLSDVAFWKSMGLSALLAGVAALSSAAVAILLTVLLRLPEAPVRVQFWLQLPTALPPLVAAFVSYQWWSNTGIIARMGHQLGWVGAPDTFPTLVNDSWHAGVLWTLFMSAMPVLLLLSIQHFQQKKVAELATLAASLGAEKKQQRWKVTIPVLWQSIRPACLAYGIFMFGAFEAPLVLGRQNPAMISVYIHYKLNRFNLADIPVAYAAVVVYALLVWSVTWLLLKEKNQPIPERL